MNGLNDEPVRLVLAYLDPGSGSYIFQVAMALLLGGIVAFRSSFDWAWVTVRRFFEKKASSSSLPANDAFPAAKKE